MNIFLAPVLFAGVFAAYVMDDSDIDNGNVEMYSQVTHTGNVVFIGNRNGVFYPCRCRQIKGEPPCCPVAYPSLGSLDFAGRRHSSDVVELKRGKKFLRTKIAITKNQDLRDKDSSNFRTPTNFKYTLLLPISAPLG